MIDFTPTEFEPQFRALVDLGAPDDDLDDIDDALQQALQGSKDAIACAYLAVTILSDANRPWTLAYSLNTAICAGCMTGDTERARLYLNQLVDLTIKHGTEQAALSAAENVRRLLPGNAKADHAPHLLYEVVRLYRHLGEIEKAIENLIIAAHLFADFGAYQTAYRSLADAEDLARDSDLLHQYVEVLSALHAVCLQEGDHAHAKRMWPTLKEKYSELGQPIPVHLVVNRATALLQTGDPKGAKDGFEEALVAMEPGSAMRFGVLVNLSACLRDLGERAQSDDRMSEARKLLFALENVDPEQPLEMELIAAKNAVLSGDFVEAASCLNRAITSLDDAVNLVEKLHYRRGLRERYVPRIERLLASLPSTGRAADVIAIVAGTRANRVSDWLHFLDWTRALALKLSKSEKDQLDHLVATLASHGAPHLYGFHEKYDDPMSSFSMTDPWRDIAEYADTACMRHGVSRPFHSATSKRGASLIAERLGAGYAVLVNLLTAGHKMLLLVGDRYVFCDLPPNETEEFFEALRRHRHEPHQAKALAQAVNLYQASLLRCLDPVLREIAVEACKGVIFVPDRMDLTPINLVMIGDPNIRAKMAAGEFEVRTCLALYPAQRYVGAPGTCLGILESDSNLQYDRTDVECFFEGSEAVGTLLEDPTWDTFQAHMKSTDSLVLSHHGVSVGLFRDPYLANMAGITHRNAMSLAALQEAAFRWPHRLVVLGTCHSGGLVNHNYQKSFRSHDLMGFPTVFLLNGQSDVLAASWAILDRFNLLFTTLFAPGLHKASAALAASSALAKLVELPKEALPDLLLRAFPPDFDTSPFVLSQLDNLRRQPFCYGAYQIYTLL